MISFLSQTKKHLEFQNFNNLESYDEFYIANKNIFEILNLIFLKLIILFRMRKFHSS